MRVADVNRPPRDSVMRNIGETNGMPGLSWNVETRIGRADRTEAIDSIFIRLLSHYHYRAAPLIVGK